MWRVWLKYRTRLRLRSSALTAILIGVFLLLLLSLLILEATRNSLLRRQNCNGDTPSYRDNTEYSQRFMVQQENSASLPKRRDFYPLSPTVPYTLLGGGRSGAKWVGKRKSGNGVENTKKKTLQSDRSENTFKRIRHPDTKQYLMSVEKVPGRHSPSQGNISQNFQSYKYTDHSLFGLKNILRFSSKEGNAHVKNILTTNSAQTGNLSSKFKPSEEADDNLFQSKNKIKIASKFESFKIGEHHSFGSKNNKTIPPNFQVSKNENHTFVGSEKDYHRKADEDSSANIYKQERPYIENVKGHQQTNGTNIANVYGQKQLYKDRLQNIDANVAKFYEPQKPYGEFYKLRDLLTQRAEEDPEAARHLALLYTFNPVMSRKERAQLMYTVDVFKRAMETHRLTYFLIGGTLLGAHRHHGIIPWDDDVDIGLNNSQWSEVRQVLRNIPGFTLADPVDFQWKFYLSDLPPMEFHDDYKWPYLDLFWFTENATHVLGLTEAVSHVVWEKRHVMPLTYIPWERWTLPAPLCVRRALSVEFDIATCAPSSYSHKRDITLPGFDVDCPDLFSVFPFVFRTTDPRTNSIVETRKVGNNSIENINVPALPDICDMENAEESTADVVVERPPL